MMLGITMMLGEVISRSGCPYSILGLHIAICIEMNLVQHINKVVDDTHKIIMMHSMVYIV